MFSIADERKKGFNNGNLINPRMPESEIKKALNSAILYFQSSIKTENVLKVMQKRKIRLTENEQIEMCDAFLSMRVNEVTSQTFSKQNTEALLKRDIKFINIYNSFGYDINLELRFKIIEEKKQEEINIEKNLASVRKIFNLSRDTQYNNFEKLKSATRAEEYFCQLERNLLNQEMNKDEHLMNTLCTAMCNQRLLDIIKTLRIIKEQGFSFTEERKRNIQDRFIKDRVIKICIANSPRSKANFYIEEDEKILNALASFNIYWNIDREEIRNFFSSLTHLTINSMAFSKSEYGSMIIKSPAMKESVEMYLLLFEKKIFQIQLNNNKENIIRHKVTQRI